MKRKLISLLSVLMIFAFSLSAFAEEATENTPNADSTDIVGYSDSRVVKKDFTNVKRITEFDPEDTQTTEYVIGSVDDWKAFCDHAKLYNFSGMTIYLGADLDFKDVEGIRPVGGGGCAIHYITPFSGTFDGQGYTIDNLIMDAGVAETQDSGFWGLFGVLKGGTIKNLILGEGCTFTNLGKTHFRVGGIVGAIQAEKHEHSEIHNCWNKGTMNGNRFVAGIVGHVYVSETGAWKNDGLTQVTAAERNEAAAVVEHIITNCTNTGTIHAIQNNAGGIVGHVGAALDVINCRNAGKVSADSLETKRAVGGIVGMYSPAASNTTSVSELRGCINNGEVTGKGVGAGTGGIVGVMKDGKFEITQNKNYGIVTNTTEGAIVNNIVGGIEAGKEGDVKADNVAYSSTDVDATLEAALKADSTISGVSETLPEAKPVQNEETNAPEVTEKPAPSKPSKPSAVTEAPVSTSAPETEAPAPEETGCKSVVSCVPVLLTAMAAGWVCLNKKRR